MWKSLALVAIFSVLAQSAPAPQASEEVSAEFPLVLNSFDIKNSWEFFKIYLNLCCVEPVLT